MKIVYLHYHLKPGGVTTVIKQQIDAVKDDCEILVIAGSPPTDHFPVETAVVPGIGYDQPGVDTESPETVAQKIIDTIYNRWNSGCDVIHVHNPLLAKNKNFLKILSAIQEKNIRLFLQIHDFAEDGRPWSYYSGDAYPADCHYGVINSRDFEILIKSGLNHNGLHLLANTVSPFKVQPEKRIHKEIVLYPVRAIRRKNIGEALLLTLFFQNNETLAITLPPNSPRDWITYDGWKKIARDNDLNVIFEAANQYDFIDLVKSAKCLITTSISEGFGFAFLEPWTAGQALAGRNLPDICRDFSQNGIQLDHLYHQILIPVDRIDINQFYEKWKTCILKNACRFNIEISTSQIDTAFETITTDNCIDFAHLNEAMQQHVISDIINDSDFKKQIVQLNPFLANVTRIPDCHDRIAHNRTSVLSSYTRKAYQHRLMEIYTSVMQEPVCQQINKQTLVSEFLNPETFSLLKWSDDDV
jgi:glycosyltransferase involved in cell wall biosynthesis